MQILDRIRRSQIDGEKNIVQIINVQQTYDILVVIGSIPLWLRDRWCIPVNGDVYIVSLILLPYLIHRSFWSNLSFIKAI